LLPEVRDGDPAAVQQLWERYFPRLVGLARKKLQGTARRAADEDEEDAALSAFASFCRNAERGRFPELADRDGLWRLLMVITVRKVAHLVRDQGRRPAGEEEGLEKLLSREPDPAFAAEVADQCRRLLSRLANPTLEKVARWRMEGYTVEEIADRSRLGCDPRTVKRKLDLIRRIWTQEDGR
jgi:DNA-directed RNA polymerase specialized sigma24 family protein